MNLTLQPENMSCADFLPSKRDGEKETKKSLPQTKSTKSTLLIDGLIFYER